MISSIGRRAAAGGARKATVYSGALTYKSSTVSCDFTLATNTSTTLSTRRPPNTRKRATSLAIIPPSNNMMMKLPKPSDAIYTKSF